MGIRSFVIGSVPNSLGLVPSWGSKSRGLVPSSCGSIPSEGI